MAVCAWLRAVPSVYRAVRRPAPACVGFPPVLATAGTAAHPGTARRPQCNASWAELFSAPTLTVNSPLCEIGGPAADEWSMYEPPDGSCELDRRALAALPADRARVVRLRCAKCAATLEPDAPVFLAGKPGAKPVLQEPGRYSTRDKVTGRPLCAAQRSRASLSRPALAPHFCPPTPAHPPTHSAGCCPAHTLPPV